MPAASRPRWDFEASAVLFSAGSRRRVRVNVGDQAPDFEAQDQHGNAVALRDLLEVGPVVVYFYPKAMTPG